MMGEANFLCKNLVS